MPKRHMHSAGRGSVLTLLSGTGKDEFSNRNEKTHFSLHLSCIDEILSCCKALHLSNLIPFRLKPSLPPTFWQMNVYV
jgi:hypothetical protein